MLNIKDFLNQYNVMINDDEDGCFVSYMADNQQFTLDEARDFLDYIKENTTEIENYLEVDEFVLFIDGYTIDGLIKTPSTFIRKESQVFESEDIPL